MQSCLRARLSRRGLALLAVFGSSFGALNCASPSATGSRSASFGGALSSPVVATKSRPRATREEILSWGPGTYIDRIIIDRDSMLDRWPNRVAEPIRVWIDSAPATAPAPEFAAAVHDAFDEWSDAGIPIRFRFVTSPRDAEVRVFWVTSLVNKTGSTTWRASRDGWLRGSDITLATHMSSGRSLDVRGMRAIALHEIGHMLGLSHSTDGHDIMAPLVRVGDLSATDRATARLLYTFPAGRIH